MYRARLEAIERELIKLTPSKVSSEVTPQVAHQRSKNLSTLNERFDRSVAIRLVVDFGEAILR